MPLKPLHTLEKPNLSQAFVGGLYLDQGDGTVRSWLNKLFRPYAISAYQIVRRQHGLPPLPHAHIANSLNDTGTTTKDLTSLISRLNLDVSPEALVNEHVNGHPTYAGSFGRNSNVTEPTIGHLPLFNQLLAKANKCVEWVYDDMNVGKALKGDHPGSSAYRDMGLPAEGMVKGTKVTPVWYVKVLVDGELYGQGKGSTKKAARNEAAKEGLEKLGIKVWLVGFHIKSCVLFIELKTLFSSFFLRLESPVGSGMHSADSCHMFITTGR